MSGKSPLPVTIEVTCPPETATLRFIRGVVATVSREIGFSPDQADLIEISVDEACTNVIRHAYPGRKATRVRKRQTIRVEIRPASDHLCVRVIDTGVGLPARGVGGPDSLEQYSSHPLPHGLGSLIIRQFMDEVAYDSSSGAGTILSMVKYLTR